MMILRRENGGETLESADFVAAAVVPMEIEHYVWVREFLEALNQRRRLQGNRRMFIVNWAMLLRDGEQKEDEDDKEEKMDETD